MSNRVTVTGGGSSSLGKTWVTTAVSPTANPLVFTIPDTPVAGSLRLVLGYQEQKPVATADYTVVGNVITYAVVPDPYVLAQGHWAQYTKA